MSTERGLRRFCVEFLCGRSVTPTAPVSIDRTICHLTCELEQNISYHNCRKMGIKKVTV